MSDLGEVSIQAVRAGLLDNLEARLIMAAAAACLLAPLIKAARGKWSALWPHPVSSAAHRREQKRAAADVFTHESLTSLPNRLLLEDRLRQNMLHSDRRGCRFAVMVLNLDRFKSINDSLGRGVGDQLLIEVGNRLFRTIREMDTLARHGSDEFVLLATDIDSLEDAHAVVRRVMSALASPLRVGDMDIYPDASVGVSLYPDDGHDVNALLGHSDTAMGYAKKMGGRQAQFFAPEMSGWTLERFQLTNELRQAVAAQQLELRYQPKMDVVTGAVCGVEALLRWRHPTRGLLAPGAFLPLAEETRLVVPISEWALREACRQAVDWRREHGFEVSVAVNVSAHQFQHDLVTHVRRALSAVGLAPELLQLELTEGTLIEKPDQAADILRELRAMGVRISIDDFGVNCSCLSYLRNFSIDELKIDRSFVATLVNETTNEAIVRAIIALAHGLGLKVVAEGVETVEQLNFLAQLHCDQYQGGLCSEPLTAGDLTDFLSVKSASGELESIERVSFDRAAGDECGPHG
jgi:diguanylate cyclase